MVDVYGIGVADVEGDDKDDAWKAEEVCGYDEEFLEESESGEGDVD